MILRRIDDGAEKCALCDFRREEETTGASSAHRCGIVHERRSRAQVHRKRTRAIQHSRSSLEAENSQAYLRHARNVSPAFARQILLTGEAHCGCLRTEEGRREANIGAVSHVPNANLALPSSHPPGSTLVPFA
jgi:hypothetical protein